MTLHSLRTRALTTLQLDIALAAVFLVAFEIDITTTRHHRGPLAINILIVAGITLLTVIRRAQPLVYVTGVMALGVVMEAWFTSPLSLVTPLYVLFVPAYTVGAYQSTNRAVIGLAICLAGPWAMLAMRHASPGDWVFSAGMSGAAWAAGRALRARRLLNVELALKTERLAAERESRERLAVADERGRIARELHAVVAASVSAMVVQTEVAQHLIDESPERADEAMAAVEAAGRETLTEMRRILGVLRHSDETAALAPQPGVGQIGALVEDARSGHRQVTLEVTGEPGPLPASVDLGMYRILEDALAEAARGPVAVRLGFSERDVALSVTLHDAQPDWPTLAMRERVSVCDGEVEFDGAELHVRLPRTFDNVLTGGFA